MAEIYDIFSEIYSGLAKIIEDCGLTAVVPDGVEKGQPPIKTLSGRTIVEYKGEGKAAKIEHFGSKILLMGAVKDGEILSSDLSQLSETLLEAESADEKTVKYIVNEFGDTLVETFGTKEVKPVKKKLPQPVSKASAKSGMLSYDPNTLANRLTAMYPEIREEYRKNCETYGQFLSEDFFMNHGTPVIMKTIKENNPQQMKRLFNLLNEIYEDGTNETQSLIAVSILGSMNNDMEMLAACVDYMSEDMTGPVIAINKYLASSSGKGAKMRLENPPKYKPKKKKSGGVASKLGM